MPFEKPNEEAAHEEANMIKAQVSSEYFNKWIEHGATAQEYDAASEEIDELKKLAEEESDTAKILYKIGRTSFHIGNILLGDLFKNARELAEQNAGKPEEEQVKDFRKELLGKLDDAAAKLRQAQEAGIRYGEAESLTEEPK